MYLKYRVAQNPFGKGWLMYDVTTGHFQGQPGGVRLPYRTKKEALAAVAELNRDWRETMVSVSHGDVE